MFDAIAFVRSRSKGARTAVKVGGVNLGKFAGEPASLEPLALSEWAENGAELRCQESESTTILAKLPKSGIEMVSLRSEHAITPKDVRELVQTGAQPGAAEVSATPVPERGGIDHALTNGQK